MFLFMSILLRRTHHRLQVWQRLVCMASYAGGIIASQVQASSSTWIAELAMTCLISWVHPAKSDSIDLLHASYCWADRGMTHENMSVLQSPPSNPEYLGSHQDASSGRLAICS